METLEDQLSGIEKLRQNPSISTIHYLRHILNYKERRIGGESIYQSDGAVMDDWSDYEITFPNTDSPLKEALRTTYSNGCGIRFSGLSETCGEALSRNEVYNRIKEVLKDAYDQLSPIKKFLSKLPFAEVFF